MSLSASGARIRGDDYQHLVAWYLILDAIRKGHHIIHFGVEDPEAGAVDDVTLHHKTGSNMFYQVKSSVDTTHLLNCTWLMDTLRSKKSILQKFFDAWQNLKRDGVNPKVELVTNRPIDHSDPVMGLIDGRDRTLAMRFKEAASAKLTEARAAMAQHLGIDEDILIQFLSDFTIRFSKSDHEWKESTALVMACMGMRNDDETIKACIGIVREWVASGTRQITPEVVNVHIETFKAALPFAIISVSALEHAPCGATADVALNWVHLFQGDEPKTRRILHDQSLWNSELRPAFRSAVSNIRSIGINRVLLSGFMRLPTAFTFGSEFSHTAGFEVLGRMKTEMWSSDGTIVDFPVVLNQITLGKGNELAIAVSVSVDLAQDVENNILEHTQDAAFLFNIIPAAGAGNLSIKNVAEARGCALTIRDQVRDIARSHKATKIHLFLATPSPLALFLGHRWDRMPDTQLYEDLGSNRGYRPSFFLPN